MSLVRKRPDAHVAESLTAAATALCHLEQSLRRSGFVEGASAYQRMAEVVLSQRVVYESDDGLCRRYEEVGATASRIFGLLHPYAQTMRRLAVLAGERDETALDTVVAQLERRGARGASAPLLARLTRLPRAEVDRALTDLVTAGRVRAPKPGGGRAFVSVRPAEQSARPRRAVGRSR